LNLWINVLY